jgi:hypothetical protein
MMREEPKRIMCNLSVKDMHIKMTMMQTIFLLPSSEEVNNITEDIRGSSSDGDKVDRSRTRKHYFFRWVQYFSFFLPL